MDVTSGAFWAALGSIMLANLVSESEFQPNLIDTQTASNHRFDIDKIVDEINRRMGDNRNPVITRASMGTDSSGKGWKMRAERHSPNYTTNWRELPVVKI